MKTFLAAVLVAGLVIAPLAVALVGCSREPQMQAAGKPDQVYTVRGQIATLPDPAKPASELMIRHEEIPDFVNKDGKVVGMNSMIMPFTPAPGVSLKDLKIGDKVEFVFEVRWKPRMLSQLTGIKTLPEDTVLDFGRPKSGS